MPVRSRPPSPGARTRSRCVVLLALLLGLLAAACRTEVDVHVQVEPDGSGRVTVTVDLDAEAAAQLGDPAGLSFEDMTSAGWEVDPPAARDGGLRIVAVRTFATPEQLASVLDEVGGADGVFSGTSLELSDGFAGSSTEFRTDLALSGDPAQFSDEQLTQVLGGLPLGRTPEELALLGADRPDAATLTVRVSLPGGADEANGEIDGGVASWTAPMTGGTATDEELTASAEDRRTTTLVLAGAGALLVVAAVVVAVVGLTRRAD
ncbi:hypothetical protein [Dermatobacter hominis]|uniref:hypothetical protein n=1 Tax=Dermatobacter hominis TaxID=2884263 RepID=UPI001D123818|nr:hypothetical protein [Dermatobacter hominis]UDY34462.1 hypothetical protein LH044_14085 [Dermatobacter hominis]